jgi:hypothetical protein
VHEKLGGARSPVRTWSPLEIPCYQEIGNFMKVGDSRQAEPESSRARIEVAHQAVISEFLGKANRKIFSTGQGI